MQKTYKCFGLYEIPVNCEYISSLFISLQLSGSQFQIFESSYGNEKNEKKQTLAEVFEKDIKESISIHVIDISYLPKFTSP